jgi:hypothetical protein
MEPSMNRAVREMGMGALVLSLLLGCGAEAAMTTKQQSFGDLAGHPTFAFTDAPAQMEPGFRSGHLFNAIMQRRIRDQLGKELRDRGYTEGAPDSAALLISFSAGGQQDVVTPGDAKGARVQGVAYTEDRGTLVLHFVDAQTNKVVWRGWVETVMTADDDLDQKVRQAVLEIMKPFPRAHS